MIGFLSGAVTGLYGIGYWRESGGCLLDRRQFVESLEIVFFGRRANAGPALENVSIMCVKAACDSFDWPAGCAPALEGESLSPS